MKSVSEHVNCVSDKVNIRNVSQVLGQGEFKLREVESIL